MNIRRAIEHDAGAIAEIHVASWVFTYRSLVPDAFLDSLSVEERRRKWERITANPDSATRVWVACDGDDIIGFGSTGVSSHGDRSESLAELFTLYLRPDWIGRGVGQHLVRHALDDLAARGFTAVILWVLEANAAARRFYERGGWRLDGGTQVNELGMQVRYRRSLGG